MKITENTPNRLVVVERPWFAAAILLMFAAAILYGLVTDWAGLEWPMRVILPLFGVGILLILHYSIHWVRTEFDRMSGRVDISRRGPFCRTQRSYPLKYLKRARVQEQNHEGSTYRITLEFDEAILAEMDPLRREHLEKQEKRGFRQASPNEVPLTNYYSGTLNANEIATSLNQWIDAAVSTSRFRRRETVSTLE